MSLNQFGQFLNDSATLINKDKHQAFRMKFADAKFRHNDAIALSFRKPLTHKSDKVAGLVHEE